jgi:hypothetical protein
LVCDDISGGQENLPTPATNLVDEYKSYCPLGAPDVTQPSQQFAVYVPVNLAVFLCASKFEQFYNC